MHGHEVPISGGPALLVMTKFLFWYTKESIPSNGTRSTCATRSYWLWYLGTRQSDKGKRVVGVCNESGSGEALSSLPQSGTSISICHEPSYIGSTVVGDATRPGIIDRHLTYVFSYSGIVSREAKQISY